MRRILATMCLAGLIAAIVLGLVANYAYDHGPFYATGGMIEFNDGDSVRPEYREDLSQVVIPDWVRWYRSHGPIVFTSAFGLFILGAFLWVKHEPTPPLDRWAADYYRLHGDYPSEEETNDWIREYGDYYQKASLKRLE